MPKDRELTINEAHEYMEKEGFIYSLGHVRRLVSGTKPKIKSRKFHYQRLIPMRGIREFLGEARARLHQQTYNK